MKRFLLAFLIFVLCAQPALGAVAFVAASTDAFDTNQLTTVDGTLTVSSTTDSAVVCWVTWFGATTNDAVTWDPTGANQAFTAIAATHSNGSFRQRGWIRTGITAGASKTVRATMNTTGTAIVAIACGHFSGVDQTTPVRVGSYNTSTSAGLSPQNLVITSQADDMTFTTTTTDAFQSNPPTTNKTLIQNEINNSIGIAIGSDYATGASTVTHTWTNSGAVGMFNLAGGSLAASTGSPPAASATSHRRIQ